MSEEPLELGEPDKIGENIFVINLRVKSLEVEISVANKCAQLLADYANHDHGYWSSPPEVPRCSGVNSIDECDFTMNLRRQFKKAVKAWELQKLEEMGK